MTKSWLHKRKSIWSTAIYYIKGRLESVNMPKKEVLGGYRAGTAAVPKKITQ